MKCAIIWNLTQAIVGDCQRSFASMISAIGRSSAIIWKLGFNILNKITLSAWFIYRNNNIDMSASLGSFFFLPKSSIRENF